MRNLVCIIFCYIIFLLCYGGHCLRCRSGNQQTDAQLQKVLQICRKRYAGHRTDNGNSMSTESHESESDSSSDEDIFDKKFFYGKNDRTYNVSSSNQNKNQQNFSGRNGDSNTYSNNRLYNGNSRDSFGRTYKTNDRDLQNMNGSNRRNNGNNYDNDENNNGGREQACIIQCFFNELNVVDRKGFPERDSVIELMSQNIQDPELKDFVEESIVDCFRYLDSTTRKEKCDFSQKLLTCLAEKGREKCEDWDN